MARPRAEELPIHTKYRFNKLKDGTTSVYLVEYKYSYDIQNYKEIHSKKIGYLPENCTDLNEMVPVENPKPGPKPGTRRKKPDVEISAQTPLLDVQDTRQPDKITYPSYLAYFVLMMCGGAGMSTTTQVAEFWKVHHNELCELFADCPDREISHDTVRDFYILLGKSNHDTLLKSFNAMLLCEDGVINEIKKLNSQEAIEAFKRSIYALDGQAIRATKIHPGSKHQRYVLSIYNCSKELAIAQTLVGEKTNEIPHGRELINTIDISGGIVTADALHAQTEFVQAVIDAGADYCLGLKGNQKLTEDSVRKDFNTESNQDIVCSETIDDKGHGRLERRTIKVLPGNILEPEILEKWPGLEYGCIAEVCSTRVVERSKENPKPEYRYYFSSLQFKKEYIAKQLLHVIRSHWKIENKLHWILDVVYYQDMTQCKNSDFLKGKMMLNKIVYNLTSAIRRVLEKERNESISIQSIKPMFTNPRSFLHLISKVWMSNANQSI